MKSQLGLMILNRDNFYLYTPDLGGFVTLSFPETIVKDLDLVSKDDLDNLIKNFVQASKIAPAEITMILSSDILFEKEIRGGPEESEDRQKFIDSLPFESVYKIIVPVNDKPHIVTVNRELVDGIIESFTKLDFSVVRAIPYEFLKKNSIQTVDVNNVQEIIKKSENMKIYNMIVYTQKKQPEEVVEPQGEKKGESKIRLYSLIGVLAVMGIILIYLLLRK